MVGAKEPYFFVGIADALLLAFRELRRVALEGLLVGQDGLCCDDVVVCFLDCLVRGSLVGCSFDWSRQFGEVVRCNLTSTLLGIAPLEVPLTTFPRSTICLVRASMSPTKEVAV